MYMTFFEVSPCERMICFLRKSLTFLFRPAESRNECTSNFRFREATFLEAGETPASVRRGDEDIIANNTLRHRPVQCRIEGRSSPDTVSGSRRSETAKLPSIC